jgi:hypothetical protein
VSRQVRLLSLVAEAVADRAPVDWRALDAATGSGPRAPVVAALRWLDRLAATCAGGASLRPAIRGRVRLPIWVGLATAACLAVVLAGLLGVALGVPDRAAVPIGLQVAAALVFGVTGAALVMASNERRGCWLGGWFLTMAAAVSYRPMQWLLRLGPDAFPVREILACLVPEALMPVFLALFVRDFPRAARLSWADRYTKALVFWAALTAVVCGVGHILAAARRPLAPHAAPVFGFLARTHPDDTYWLLLYAPAAFALVLMLARRHRAEEEERRRVTLFVTGLALGLAPAIVVIVLGAVLPPVRQLLADARALRIVAFAVYGLALTTPLTTAYAIRAQGVLSVRFVVRRAVQHLLARSTLSVLAFVPSALLLLLLFVHRDESLARILSGGNGFLLAACAAVASLSLAARGPLLARLDRALLPRRGDHGRSLYHANQNLLRAHGGDEVLELLMEEIRRALGAKGCVLPATDRGYLSRQGSVRSIPGGSAIAALAQSGDGPLLVDPLDARSVFRWLPEADRGIVVDGGVALIVPIPGSTRPRAVLALQTPEDCEPYTTEDLVYLAALASAGGMALARSWTPHRIEDAALDERTAGECRSCGSVSETDEGHCRCGAPLEPCLLPVVLNGKFRLNRRLGVGAMGVVYEAEDLDLGRTVALKTLPRVSPDLALRLRQEARSMARVLHSRLAMIFGCESWRGVPVLVLERLAGTLASRLGSPLGLRESLEVGVAASEGLTAMHVQGLLHRDIKPSNVGFSRQGGIKLLDFGLAHLLSEATDRALSRQECGSDRPIGVADLDLSSRVVGTPLYCSPERLQGAEAGPQDDVWSLSLLLYELLAGEHPWRRPGALPGDARAIPDLETLRPGCPSEIASLFRRALSVRVAERPRSAAALRSELIGRLKYVAETSPYLGEPGLG